MSDGVYNTVARFARLGPRWLCVICGCALATALVVRYLGAVHGSQAAKVLGSVLVVVVLLAQLGVFAQRRDADVIASGVLLAITVAIGGVIATCLLLALKTGTALVGVLLVGVAPIYMALQVALLVPVCIAAVWTGRRTALLLARLRGGL